MKHMKALKIALLMVLVSTWICGAEDKPKEGEKKEEKKTEEKSIFPDKNLETAVRKFVFEKRDNDKPIVEADVVNLSTIEGKGFKIQELTVFILRHRQ